MKIISSSTTENNLAKEGGDEKYFSSQYHISKVRNEEEDIVYLVKEPKISDELRYNNFQINAAYFERLSACLYQYFSPNAKVAQVEIAETDNQNIAVASEFIENYHSLNEFDLTIHNDQLQLQYGNRIINLDPQTFFRIFLTARLIDDYDAYGNGDNTGIIFKENEAILAKIDTDALKFAHPDQNTRQFYSTMGLVSLISKKMNQRYIDPETPNYITSYPLSLISYSDQGSSKDKEFASLNALLEFYIPGADVKDLLFNKLSYKEIRNNPLLYNEFCKALHAIVTVEDHNLAELIDLMIPQDTENFVLIRKALLHNLIIRREQLKHIYLLEFEYENLSNQKGEQLDFNQMIELAASRVSYTNQLNVIEKLIDDLASIALNDYSSIYIEGSIAKLRSISNADKSIKNAIDHVVRTKLKEEIEKTFADASEEFIEKILNNIGFIEFLLEDSEYIAMQENVDIKIIENVIYYKNILLMTRDDAEKFIKLQKTIYESLDEDKIIYLLNLDEFNLLKDLALGYLYNTNLETLYVILMNHPQFINIINEEITIYQTQDNEFYALTENEDDETSYFEAAEIKDLERSNEILSSKKTSLLWKIIEQGNIDFALLLTSFGANFLPSEKDTNEYYTFQDLISEKIVFNMDNNIAALKVIEKNANDQSDDTHDFIDAIINSIIDAVTNLPSGISLFLQQIPMISLDILANEMSQNRHHSFFYRHPGHDDFDPSGNEGSSITFFAGEGENPIVSQSSLPYLGLNNNSTDHQDD